MGPSEDDLWRICTYFRDLVQGCNFDPEKEREKSIAYMTLLIRLDEMLEVLEETKEEVKE